VIRRVKFTLIEVMTALAVFSIFMVLIVQFFGAAQKLWTATEKETRLSNKAALLFNTIERYVRSAKVGHSVFYISNSTATPFEIMKKQFSGTRWEQDGDAYGNDNSTQLIFAASSAAKLHSKAASDIRASYILGFVQAQDNIQLRVICDKDTNFFALLSATRDTILNQFKIDQNNWLIGAAADEYGSGQEGDARVTYNIINHVTAFKVDSYILSTTVGPDPLVPRDPGLYATYDGTPPHALLITVTLLGDDDYAKWRTLCGSQNSEPEGAKAFRKKAERIFSRLIYVGKIREVPQS